MTIKTLNANINSIIFIMKFIIRDLTSSISRLLNLQNELFTSGIGGNISINI